MISTIGNQNLTVKINSLGAEMMEICSENGTQFLWDGDPKYWTGRAPNLFPYVGRLTNNTYTYQGNEYQMKIHGFAGVSEFTVEEESEAAITYRLESSEETLRQYPFAFAFKVRYELIDWTIRITYLVENKDGKTMIFGLGGHPAFRVPLEEGTKFSDYRLEFSESCTPDQVIYTATCFQSGKEKQYPLKNGTTRTLYHEMFDDDAVILRNMAREITLCSDLTKKSVTVSYPKMSYLGIWHKPCTDAPYVCIEPWTSLSARQGFIENLSCQSDLIHLDSGETYRNTWCITLNQG